MARRGKATGGEDFAGYVAARWPLLVRTLVLLGCPEAQAPEVALDALARCEREWPRILAEADVDDVVRRELVAAWEDVRHAGQAWWDRAEAAPSLDPALAAELDLLTPDQRRDLVLARTDRLQAAAALLPVLAPPTAPEIRARGREHARRRTRRSARLTLLAGLPLLLVAAGVSWGLNLSDAGAGQPPLARLEAQPMVNPTNVVWEAAGELHLPRATVAIPPVRQVTADGSGAVYADVQGRVIEVSDDGTQRLLGHEDVEHGFVGSDAEGWVAWIEDTSAGPRLTAYDLTAHRVLGRLGLPRGQRSRPVAIDGHTVFYADTVGTHAWLPLEHRKPTLETRSSVLVDAVAGVRLFQVGAARLQVSVPPSDATVPLLGIGGGLSDDGRLLVTRTGRELAGLGPVAIYDTRTGNALQTGVGKDELAIDAVLGPDQTVTYLIARKADRPLASDELRASFSGALQLRTCRLRLVPQLAPSCELIAGIPVSGISPKLAH